MLRDPGTPLARPGTGPESCRAEANIHHLLRHGVIDGAAPNP